MSIIEGAFIEGLKYISRKEITPYDSILLSKEPGFIKIEQEIGDIILEMVKAKDDMTLGKFKWDKSEKNAKWTVNMKPIFKALCQLPEKQMIDLIEIPKFRECLDPFTLRIYLESTEEIFEHPERMPYLENISAFFELFMRLHLKADVNYLPRIPSRHIQLMDPFMRKNIREQNRNNMQFKDKYLNKQRFHLKKFCLEFMERLFTINKERALGTGLRRLRLNILRIINILFELGLWKGKKV